MDATGAGAARAGAARAGATGSGVTGAGMMTAADVTGEGVTGSGAATASTKGSEVTTAGVMTACATTAGAGATTVGVTGAGMTTTGADGAGGGRGGAGRAEAGSGSVPTETLGPTEARNWGWIVLLGGLAALLGAAALEATLRLGVGWRETGMPLLLAAPFAAASAWVWRQPPFERTTLVCTPDHVEIVGRRARVALGWHEIAAITLRPSSMGPAHMTLERAAPGQAGIADDPITPAAYLTAKAETAADDAPGVMFPVRAVGVSAEEIVAFLGRGAAGAGARLEEPMRGDGRNVHRFGGPRRWLVIRT